MKIDYDWMNVEKKKARGSRLPYARVYENGVIHIYKSSMQGKVAIGYDEKSNIIVFSSDEQAIAEHRKAVRKLCYMSDSTCSVSIKPLIQRLIKEGKCRTDVKFRVGKGKGIMMVYLCTPYVEDLI